jgi:hypothetical protein
LLAHAKAQLMHWADVAQTLGPTELALQHQGKQLQVQLMSLDMSSALSDVPLSNIHLVTAAALFDLAAASWIDALCTRLQCPLYTVLNFNGQMQWQPPHPLDTVICRAFAAHQQTDKGLGGSALGAECTTYLRQRLELLGFDVITSDSPWQVDQTHAAMYDLLMSGIADAVEQTKQLQSDELSQWQAFHTPAQYCHIGHFDLYAARPAQVQAIG